MYVQETQKTYIHDTLSNLFSQLQFSLSFTDQDGFQSTLKFTTQRLAQDNPCTCLQKWEFHGSNENGPLQHIDMVLVDNQVNQTLIMLDTCFLTPLEL